MADLNHLWAVICHHLTPQPSRTRSLLLLLVSLTLTEPHLLPQTLTESLLPYQTVTEPHLLPQTLTESLLPCQTVTEPHLLSRTLTESLPLHLPSRTPMESLLLLPVCTELLVEEPVPGPVSALIALEAASLDLVAVLHHKYMGLLPRPRLFSPHLLRTVLSPQHTEPLHSKVTLRRSTMHPRMTSQWVSFDLMSILCLKSVWNFHEYILKCGFRFVIHAKDAIAFISIIFKCNNFSSCRPVSYSGHVNLYERNRNTGHQVYHGLGLTLLYGMLPIIRQYNRQSN
jgi:hypothetical protein